jgi:large subunit ribosomal protein L30
MANKQQIKITLVKSLAGQLKSIQSSVRGLGLRHLHHTITVADTKENRGMINAATHMLKVDQA